jgi:hypothetical protein
MKASVVCNKTTLLFVILVQWVLLIYVISCGQPEVSIDAPSSSTLIVLPSQKLITSSEIKRPREAPDTTNLQWKGVAATLALRAPKWFHRRFTTMLHNVLDNTPNDWALQIFIQPEWWRNEVLKLHRGIHHLLQHPRVIVTELPGAYWKYKPKQILTQTWFWEQMVADHIFLFSGNGVMCSHTVVSIHQFDGIDFCGAPSRRVGGDAGTHSIRSRQAMLDAIEYGKPSMDIGSESEFFSSTLAKMIKENVGNYRLATKNETILLAGGAELISENNLIRTDMEAYGPSLVMSGTGMNLDWNVRDALLQICPEWKLIFPSLHDPNCFGASPDAEKCAASICALKADRPKQGC